MALRMAAPFPMLDGCRITRILGSAAASDSRIATDPSRLPSSTQTTSMGRFTGLESTRAMIVRSVRDSLYTGTRTLRRGASEKVTATSEPPVRGRRVDDAAIGAWRARTRVGDRHRRAAGRARHVLRLRSPGRGKRVSRRGHHLLIEDPRVENEVRTLKLQREDTVGGLEHGANRRLRAFARLPDERLSGSNAKPTGSHVSIV